MSAYTWVNAKNGRVPPNAVEAGIDSNGDKIYIGRTHYGGDELPCRVYPKREEAFTSWNCQEHRLQDYEIFCEQKLQWVPSSEGHVPPGAVRGGRTDCGETLYIGRALHNGTEVVGKIQPSHGCIYIGSEGREISYKDYEVLVIH